MMMDEKCDVVTCYCE